MKDRYTTRQNIRLQRRATGKWQAPKPARDYNWLWLVAIAAAFFIAGYIGADIGAR